MKKKLLITSAVIVAIFIGYFIKHRSHPEAPASADIWVQAVSVKEIPLPLEVHALGTLVAKSVEITPEVAGHVNGVLFQDGKFVESGTPLIQLDDLIYRSKFESSKAQTGYSKNNFNRMVLLGKKGAISKQAIDQAEADFKEKKANMKESEVMVNKMKLLAPFSGVVGKSKVQLGDYVTIGQHLVTLTDRKHLHVEYNVPEKYLPLLKLSQNVKIKTSAYPDKIFEGKVAFISPTISTDNRSVLIYAEMANDQNLLAPGMFVNVFQSLGQHEKVLMVPARSLVPVVDGEQVYKVTDGKAYAVTILTGKRIGEEIEVVQGLKANDMVITDGQLKIKNGAKVKLKS
jgi:RND family efflux transporter MFP subunit